jgi:hypothetical protein
MRASLRWHYPGRFDGFNLSLRIASTPVRLSLPILAKRQALAGQAMPR